MFKFIVFSYIILYTGMVKILNRQLRKTLVFLGIKKFEFPGEENRNQKETWEGTAQLLAEAMSSKMENVSVEEAAAMVERCH